MFLYSWINSTLCSFQLFSDCSLIKRLNIMNRIKISMNLSFHFFQLQLNNSIFYSYRCHSITSVYISFPYFIRSSFDSRWIRQIESIDESFFFLSIFTIFRLKFRIFMDRVHRINHIFQSIFKYSLIFIPREYSPWKFLFLFIWFEI